MLPAEKPGDSREETTLVTFGDSILDCGSYNDEHVTPGALLIRNRDDLFPEFRGQDLSTRRPARLDHRARDGATVSSLKYQAHGFTHTTPAMALLTIGGNDLLRGLATDAGSGLAAFEHTLEAFLHNLPLRPVLIGNVYDPSFGDDQRNFLGVDPQLARRNHRRVQEILAAAADRYGHLVDLHSHFVTGNDTWYVHTIEPSLQGASEVRRAFLPYVLAEAARLK